MHELANFKFTDCVHTNFSVNLITGGNYTVKSFNDFYSSPRIVWVMKLKRLRWTGHVACMGIGEMCIQDFVGKPEGRRLLGIPMCRQQDNIKWLSRNRLGSHKLEFSGSG